MCINGVNLNLAASTLVLSGAFAAGQSALHCEASGAYASTVSVYSFYVC